jgi:hypothetical protein
MRVHQEWRAEDPVNHNLPRIVSPPHLTSMADAAVASMDMATTHSSHAAAFAFPTDQAAIRAHEEMVWDELQRQYMNERRANRGNQDPSVRRKRTNRGPRLRDIIGHGCVKLRMDEMLLPLGLPEAILDTKFTGKRTPPASILLYGPPGCGKVGYAHFAWLRGIYPRDLNTHTASFLNDDTLDQIGASPRRRSSSRPGFSRAQRHSQQVCRRIGIRRSPHFSTGRGQGLALAFEMRHYLF